VPSIYLEGLTLDDTNRRKMAIHGVTGKEAMEAASDPEAKAFRNHSPEGLRPGCSSAELGKGGT